MLKKLKIVIDGNTFEFESDGTIPFADVFKLAGEFLQALLNPDRAELRDAIARLDQERAAQAAAVATQPK